MDERTVPKGKWDVKNLAGDENIIHVSTLENVVKVALVRRILPYMLTKEKKAQSQLSLQLKRLEKIKPRKSRSEHEW